MAAGVGGAIAYYVTYLTVDATIVGAKTAADEMMVWIVPMVIAAGTVWCIVAYAFNDGEV